MIQGTGSNVGKSVVAAALCRILRQDGYSVAPFKSQNMALNSFVTRDGLEMGRAQVVQAEAAGIDPLVEMNPILLKPTGDARSQVVVMGKPRSNMSAKEYYSKRDGFLKIIKDAFDSLSSKFDVVVIEGAGSPAEINIKDNDIVNMKMAEMADAPVLLVTDIDRGGSFAWITGTIQLLSETERARVRGVIFNKFRGDIDILTPGYKMLEDIIKKPVLGTIPYIGNIELEDEDSVSLEDHRPATPLKTPDTNHLDIAVVKHSRISNFTDLDALEREDAVRLRYINKPAELGNPDMIIIPGTKGTIGDMKLMQGNGIADAIINRANKGCMIFGVCGGYQMMGMEIRDPLHVESEEDAVSGLGLISAITEFAPEKATYQSVACIAPNALPFNVSRELTGYEIHMGVTRLLNTDDSGNGFLKIIKRSTDNVDIDDGVAVFDGKRELIGTYLHGIFDNDSFRQEMLLHLAKRAGKSSVTQESIDVTASQKKEDGYRRLEEIARQSLDMEAIYKIITL